MRPPCYQAAAILTNVLSPPPPSASRRRRRARSLCRARPIVARVQVLLLSLSLPRQQHFLSRGLQQLSLVGMHHTLYSTTRLLIALSKQYLRKTAGFIIDALEKKTNSRKESMEDVGLHVGLRVSPLRMKMQTRLSKRYFIRTAGRESGS